MSKIKESKPSHSVTADELTFDTTLEVYNSCMCLHLQQAARAVARRFDEALRPVGLTNGQFSLLMALNRPHTPVMSEVAELLAMDRTSLTAMLKPLSRRGFLAVEPDEKDKRIRRIHLLAAGKTALGDALPYWTKTQRAIEAETGPADADDVRASLRAMLGNR